MNKSKAKMGKPSTPQNTSGNCNVGVASRNTPPSRNKTDKDIPYEGIYQNLRFCETITSLMGNTVQVRIYMLPYVKPRLHLYLIFRYNFRMGKYLKEFLAHFLLS